MKRPCSRCGKPVAKTVNKYCSTACWTLSRVEQKQSVARAAMAKQVGKTFIDLTVVGVVEDEAGTGVRFSVSCACGQKLIIPRRDWKRRASCGHGRIANTITSVRDLFSRFEMFGEKLTLKDLAKILGCSSYTARTRLDRMAGGDPQKLLRISETEIREYVSRQHIAGAKKMWERRGSH